MNFIDIDFDELEKQSNEIMAEFDRLSRKLREKIAKEVLEEAAQIFYKEQVRILSAHKSYKKFIPLLSVWTEETKQGYIVKVGYGDEVFKEKKKGKAKNKYGKIVDVKYAVNTKVLVAEFGKPGKRGIKNGGLDTLGRKIGKVEPYSHIRASRMIKNEEFMKEVERRLEIEIEKAWKEAGF